MIRETLNAICAANPPFPLELPGFHPLGRGVAVEVDSVPLLRLHSQLSEVFEAWLAPQNRQKFQPHVTIQNKVTPDIARELLRELSATWKPVTAPGVGLSLWRYRGGPWEEAGTFLFGNSAENISETVP